MKKNSQLMVFKKMITVAVVLFTSVSLFAQVQIKDIPLQEALQQAKAADKIVLLLIESVDCGRCNDVALQGFANPVFGRSVNNTCITLKINKQSKDFSTLDSLYNISNSFGLLFINADGTFLHRYSGSTSYYITYIEQLDKALNRKENPDTEFQQMQREYDKGVREFTLLYKLAAKKDLLQLDHDQLTEEMVNLAPVDSATSLSFIQFVAMQAPLIDSKANKYMRKDSRLFDDAWYLMPLPKRIAINNRINGKSKSKAIREKDIAYASRVAAVTAGTYTERRASRKSYEWNMLDYYKGVHDTANFLLASAKYYDQYLMNISVDSVQRADSLRKMEMFANALPNNTTGMQPGGVVTNAIRFAPNTQNYANELNNGAWTIYTYTKEPAYTAKALSWAKRANEFFDNPVLMDTYARLLYKTGQTKEAINWEEKAVKFSKERKMPANEFEEILSRMKAGNPAIDNY